jgi:hypothetical protein
VCWTSTTTKAGLGQRRSDGSPAQSSQDEQGSRELRNSSRTLRLMNVYSGFEFPDEAPACCQWTGFHLEVTRCIRSSHWPSSLPARLQPSP